MEDRIGLKGHVIVELRGPDGRLKARREMHNLVTANGDQYVAKKLYSAPTAMANMKLGTATTQASKTGAGSFIAVADYVSGSAKACDESSPTQGTTADITQFIRTWAIGEATANGINRVAVVDNVTDAGEADATHTLAIAVFPAAINKAAADTLRVVWNIALLGA